MSRPTKFDRDIADALFAYLEQHDLINGNLFVASVRKDGALLVEGFVQAIRRQEIEEVTL